MFGSPLVLVADNRASRDVLRFLLTTAVKHLRVPFLRRGILAALVAFFFCASISFADAAATNAARELASRIASELESRASVHVEFRDLTNSFGAVDLAEAQQAFESQLAARGLRLLKAPATSSSTIAIRVSLSDDTESRMWVAEFVRDGKPGVEIASFAVTAPSDGFSQGTVLIQRQLVVTQAEPILDFALTGAANDANSLLVVLSPNSISVMHFRDKTWQLQAKDLFPSIPGTPRDLQGRLAINGGAVDAWLANVNCTGPLADIGQTRCAEAKNPAWEYAGANGKNVSVTAARGRNWFQWMDTADGNAGREALYSIAGFVANDQALWASAGQDGRLRVYGESGAAIANLNGFGSQIVSVQTACGTGWQIMTTREGDFSKTDAVQAQEWTGRAFRPVSAEMEFDGPVLALRKGSDVNSVRAMVRNLKNGMYEAYSLSVYCNR